MLGRNLERTKKMLALHMQITTGFTRGSLQDQVVNNLSFNHFSLLSLDNFICRHTSDSNIFNIQTSHMDGQEVFEFEIWRIFNTLKFSVFLAMIRNREISIIKFSKFSTIAKLCVCLCFLRNLSHTRK